MCFCICICMCNWRRPRLFFKRPHPSAQHQHTNSTTTYDTTTPHPPPMTTARDLERVFSSHYALFRDYLGTFDARSATKATTDRLTRLPPEQLLDISRDLYDEVNRRVNEPDVPFLPVRPDLLPTRNQARQKMGTLPTPRLKELVAGVMYDMERRFPYLVAEYEKGGNRSPQDDKPSPSSVASPAMTNMPPVQARGRYDYDPASPVDTSPRGYTRTPDVGRRPSDTPGARLERSREPQLSPQPGAGPRSRDRSADPADRYRNERSDRFRSQDSKASLDRSDIRSPDGPSSDEVAKMRSDYEFKIAMLEKQAKEGEGLEARVRQYEDRLRVAEERSRGSDERARQLEDRNRKLDERIRKLEGELQTEVSRSRQTDDRNRKNDERIRELETELEREIGRGAKREQEIASQQNALASADARIAKMKQDYDALQDDYDEQQRMADSIRAEATSLLAEVKTLTSQTQDLGAERDRYMNENNKLRTEADVHIKEAERVRIDLDRARGDATKLRTDIQRAFEERDAMRTDLERLRTEHAVTVSDLEQARRDLADARMRSPVSDRQVPTPKQQSPQRQMMPLGSPVSSPQIKSPQRAASPPAALRIDNSDPIPMSLEDSYRDFEKQMDKLISASRNDTAPSVLAPMKAILLTCKSFISESEEMEKRPATHIEDRRQLTQLKDKLSDAVSRLMASAKDHASSGGTRESADYIEDDVIALSYTLRDLMDLMKYVDPNAGRSPQSAGTQKMSSPPSARPGGSQRQSPPSPRSAQSPPSPRAAKQASSQNRDTWRQSRLPAGDDRRDTLPPMDIAELKLFVEEQTDVIAHTIQDLLQTMRDPAALGEDLQDLINEIINFVDNIVYETRGTFDATRNADPDMRADAEDVLLVMTDVRELLVDHSEDIMDNPANKTVKQKVANSSYEIAKHAKELLAILD
ncbi:hypothetical protein BC831DRAFT_503408 [Entophlyctis helioformis]|nr:hypothetical protein BC831DRAFT_503408 [Entophlyctis helioformis]